MARNMGLNLIGCSIVVMAFVIGATHGATEYEVGDSFGWNVPTNEDFYSEWAATKKFLVGDKLIFNWTGTHTVANATKADYDNCNARASAFGGSGNETVFRFTLEEAQPYYFICTIGNHCARGMKFSINVESLNSDAPNAQPPQDSSAPTHYFGILSAILSSLAVYFFTRTY